MKHTIATLDRMADDDRWLGFGYINERRTDEETEPARRAQLAATDALAVEMANAAGLTYDQFFAWANSKDGRWFGDCADNLEMARRYGPKA